MTPQERLEAYRKTLPSRRRRQVVGFFTMLTQMALASLIGALPLALVMLLVFGRQVGLHMLIMSGTTIFWTHILAFISAAIEEKGRPFKNLGNKDFEDISYLAHVLIYAAMVFMLSLIVIPALLIGGAIYYFSGQNLLPATVGALAIPGIYVVARAFRDEYRRRKRVQVLQAAKQKRMMKKDSDMSKHRRFGSPSRVGQQSGDKMSQRDSFGRPLQVKQQSEDKEPDEPETT